MIRGLVFDVDGVLLDSATVLSRAYDEALVENGLPARGTEYSMQFMGMELHEWTRNMLPREMRQDDIMVEKVSFSVTRSYEEQGGREKSGPYPEVKAALSGLEDDGFSLAVATNNTKETAMAILARLDALKFFEFVATVSDTGKPKPEPDMLLLAAEKIGCKPEETLFVGDSSTDMITGQRAGIKTVLVNRPWNEKLEHDLRIKNLLELGGLAKSL